MTNRGRGKMYEIIIKFVKGTTFNVTRRRLIKMLKQLAKKDKVTLAYEYNNSMGHHNIREMKGKIVGFSVIPVLYDGKTPYEYQINVNYREAGTEAMKSWQVFVTADAEFYGYCQIRWCNSGPCCYITGSWEGK